MSVRRVLVPLGTRPEIIKLAPVVRALRAAGVEAVLQMWEGQSHGQYNRDITAPETKEYNGEIARFFDQHLGR